jgi:hypothetical protein
MRKWILKMKGEQGHKKANSCFRKNSQEFAILLRQLPVIRVLVVGIF